MWIWSHLQEFDVVSKNMNPHYPKKKIKIQKGFLFQNIFKKSANNDYVRFLNLENLSEAINARTFYIYRGMQTYSIDLLNLCLICVVWISSSLAAGLKLTVWKKKKKLEGRPGTGCCKLAACFPHFIFMNMGEFFKCVFRCLNLCFYSGV